MTIDIDMWRSALTEVALDPEAAPGPRVRALEIIGRDQRWIEQCPCRRRPWWLWWIPTKEEETE